MNLSNRHTNIMTMSSHPREQQLHIYFFPLMAAGHMIPVVDMARQFARHDPSVKATIVLPHLNAPQFEAAIERDRQKGSDIHIRQVIFPTAQVGLPDDCVSLGSITSPDMSSKFHRAVGMLQTPSEHLIREDLPDCIVSDYFISWTAGIAAEFRIPRIVFHVSGFFSLCVHHSIKTHMPHACSDSDDDVFLVPGLPHAVVMTRRKLSNFFLNDLDNTSKEILESANKADHTSIGTVFNTFKELEPDYAEYYKQNIRSKVWTLCQTSLCNTDADEKAQRGGTLMLKKQVFLDWLSTKEPNSVIYVCFGTLVLFSATQIHEIAIGLESCQLDFIWVIKDGELLPEGFEERVGERGLIVKSWAPQVLILEHESVGVFLTHCGWNSLLEGVCAGKPMVTWPITFDQFENEILVTEVLKIGVAVGCFEWSDRLDVGRAVIKGENLSKAVKEVMFGEASVEMKKRALTLSEQAKKAVQKGGSSYNDLDSLLGQVRAIKDGKIVV